MATDTLPNASANLPSSTPVTAAVTVPPNPATSPATVAWMGALFGAVILLAFIPLLQTHVQHLWERPHYQFFPFALVGSVILGWSYWRTGAAPLTPGNVSLTLAGLTLSWVTLAVAEIFLSPPLAAIAVLILVAAVIHGVGGIPLLRTLLPAWAFAWITVRPPLALDSRLVVALQDLTSSWSSAILDTLGILHLPDGNVLEIGGRRLLVEEACAGINSFFSVLACTLFLILWLRRPWFRSLLLVVAAVGWVLIANVIRVVTIAVVFDRRAFDLSLGLRHDVLGLACFALAVLLIWSTDRLMLFVSPRAAAPPPAPSAHPMPALDALRGAARLVSWPMAVAFGLLLTLHVATYGLTPPAAPREPLPGIARLGRESLPESLAGWKRENFRCETRDHLSEYGEHSRMWEYTLDQRRAVVSLDYPFPIFHFLNTCYLNQGWKVDKSTDCFGEKDIGEPGFYVEVQMKKSALRTGYLLYCECSQQGDYLEHEGNMLRSAWNRYETAVNSWRHRLSRPEEYQRQKARQPVYQFQVFVEGNRPLSAEEQQAAQQLFFQAVKGLRKELYPES